MSFPIFLVSGFVNFIHPRASENLADCVRQVCSPDFIWHNSVIIFSHYLIFSYAYSCTFILQYARHLYYLQEMAPYDEPLRSELLGGKFTILVGGSVSHLVEVCFLIM